MRNALALVADIGLIFKQRAAQLVKTELTAHLIQVLEGFKNNQDNAQVLDYARRVYKLLKNNFANIF